MSTYTGTSGNDTLLGGTGNDIIDGLAGNDHLYGYEGNDSITGGAGDDHLWGGLGNDTLDGGDGSDAVYYSDASAAVTLYLALGTASGTGSGTDTLISIEIVFGSSFGDLLIGGAGSDFMSMSRELEPQGIMTDDKSFRFSFTKFEKQYESYYGNTVKLRFL